MCHPLRVLILVCAVLWTLPLQFAVAQDGPAVGPVDPNCRPQDVVDATWEGVCQPVPLEGLILLPALSLEQSGAPLADSTPAAGPPTQLGTVPYLTVFAKRKAATALRANTQYMTTYVQEGEFVLDVPLNTQENTVDNQVLVRAALPVQLMAPTGPENTDDAYAPVQPAQTRDCTAGCIVSAGEAVLLKPGDSATTVAGAFCLWCLVNGTPYTPSNATATPETDDSENEAGALISLVVLPFDANRRGTEPFGWSEDWEQPTVSAQEGTTTRFAWALNPGSNCRGG